MQPEQAIIALDYNSTSLLFDRKTNAGDLTALWRAAGAPENKRPIDWTRGAQAQEILEALSQREKVEISHLLFVQTGRSGGTWAHWQIALIYAHYLSPDLYLTWNEFARQCLEGRAMPDLRALVAAEVAAQLAQRRIPRQLPAPAVLSQSAMNVLATLAQLGGSGTTRQIAQALPQMSYVCVRYQLSRLARGERLHRVSLGVYELPKKAQSND